MAKKAIDSGKKLIVSDLKRAEDIFKTVQGGEKEIDGNLVLAKREFHLRNGTYWRTTLYFVIPTVLIMLSQGIYQIMDKYLALSLGSNHYLHSQEYINIFNNNYNIDNGQVVQWSDAYIKKYINLATQYTNQLFNTINAFTFMVGMGTALAYSKSFGKRDFVAMKRVCGNGLTFAIFTWIIVDIIAFILSYPGFGSILVSAQMGSAQNDIVKKFAWSYTWPLLVGSLFLFMQYFFFSLLRSEGKNTIILTTTVLGIMINIGFSFIFMGVMGMGIDGSMLSTVCSWIFNCAIYVVFIFFLNQSYIKFKLRDTYLISKASIVTQYSNGLPNFIAAFSPVIAEFISTILIIRLPNQHWDAGTSIYQSLYSSMMPWFEIFMTIGVGISHGARSIFVYNMGAKKYDRIWHVIKRTSTLTYVYFMCATLLAIAFAPQFTNFFGLETKYSIQYQTWTRISFSCLFFVSFTHVSVSFYQGIGKSMLASFLVSLRTFIIAVPLIGLGYLTAYLTQNPIFYFILIATNDLICALIISVFLLRTWISTKELRFKTIPPEDYYLYEDIVKYLKANNSEVIKQNHLIFAKK